MNEPRTGDGTRWRRASWASIGALFVALALGLGPPPSYNRLLLWELAAFADVIASGEIERVDAATFDLRVEEAWLGARAGSLLRVERFRDWTCHRRWTGYAEGQRLMVFLRRKQGVPSGLEVLGAGDEGELPFVGDAVVAQNAHDFRVRGYPVREHWPAGARMVGTALPAAELAHAALGFREAFRWTAEREVAPRRTMAEARTFGASSPIARHLFEEAVSSEGWRGPLEGNLPTISLASIPTLLEPSRVAADGPRADPGPPQPMRLTFVHSHFAASLAAPGDVDGDGIADLVVGAPGDSHLGPGQGAVWLQLLDRGGAVRSQRELLASGAGHLAAMTDHAGFGSAVAALGDLDGNGVPDLAVGAPKWSGAQVRRGGVWILFLERDGSIGRAVEIGSAPLFDGLGVGEGSGLGAALASLGDLVGDGSLWLAIGQDARFELADEHGQAVYLVSLARDGSPLRGRRIHSRGDGFDGSLDFGGALCAVGDVDGDGVHDLAIGDRDDSDGGQGRGAVWLALLAADGALRSRHKISAWEGGFEARLMNGSHFGKSLAAPGDVNGDGIPDLLVGSTQGIFTLCLRRDGSTASFEGLRIVADEDIEAPPLARSLAAVRGGASGTTLHVAVGGTRRDAGKHAGQLWWLELGPAGRLRAR